MMDRRTGTAVAAWWCAMLALAALVAPASASTLARLFAPKAELWERWSVHADDAAKTVDHAAWSAWLARHVAPAGDGIARIDYAAARAGGRASLDGYVAYLAALPISHYPRAEQFAYWVNLYNALTVQVVLDHYPVDSIRDIDISPGLFASGPWDKVLVSVEGVGVTLNDIEHRILRPIWREPRVHYAVNCASLGCPDLQRVAFTAANTEALLDKAARDYVNHPRAVTVSADGLLLSSIYNWFADDFVADGGVMMHLRRFASAATLEMLAPGRQPSGYAYDWSLNDLAR